jgi:hypothetical protein
MHRDVHADGSQRTRNRPSVAAIVPRPGQNERAATQRFRISRRDLAGGRRGGSAHQCSRGNS